MAKQFLQIPMKADLSPRTYYAAAWLSHLSALEHPDRHGADDRAGLALLHRPTDQAGFDPITWTLSLFLPVSDSEVLNSELQAKVSLSLPLDRLRRNCEQAVGRAYLQMGEQFHIPHLRLVMLPLDCTGDHLTAALAEAARVQGGGVSGLCVMNEEDRDDFCGKDLFGDMLYRLAQQKLGRSTSSIFGASPPDPSDD